MKILFSTWNFYVGTGTRSGATPPVVVWHCPPPPSPMARSVHVMTAARFTTAAATALVSALPRFLSPSVARPSSENRSRLLPCRPLPPCRRSARLRPVGVRPPFPQAPPSTDPPLALAFLSTAAGVVAPRSARSCRARARGARRGARSRGHCSCRATRRACLLADTLAPPPRLPRLPPRGCRRFRHAGCWRGFRWPRHLHLHAVARPQPPACLF